MQSSKEQPGEIRKPSSAINAKKERKATEQERENKLNRKKEIKQIQGIRSDRVHEEVWMEITDIIKEMVIKTIPKKKKCKKAKWLSEEALQIAVKTREANSKGEKERYSHLNTEFQRIARIDKKGFLSE